MNTETAANAYPVDLPMFQAQHQQLVALGFEKEKENLKLLQKADGNVALVINVLLAKKQYKEARHALRDCKEREKEERKEEKKAEKREKKAQKKEKKEQKKEEKLFKRALKGAIEKPAEKNRRRPREERAPIAASFAKMIDLTSSVTLPNSINHIVLDGNNMLFVVGAVRKLVLARKRWAAEAVLTAFARRFHKLTNIKTTIIFDECKETLEEPTFAVYRARPHFATADDALVDLAQRIPDKEGLLFVSSDVGLLRRLEEVGVHLAKPKGFMSFGAKAITASEPTQFGSPDLESFFDQFSQMELH